MYVYIYCYTPHENSYWNKAITLNIIIIKNKIIIIIFYFLLFFYLKAKSMTSRAVLALYKSVASSLNDSRLLVKLSVNF